jgi:hypothetical protein
MYDVRFTRDFRLSEFVRSAEADRLGIDNTPPPEAVDALHKLCAAVLQPMRYRRAWVLHVNSGYRSPALNAAVGGAVNSQHMRGEAADIRATRVTTGEAVPIYELALEVLQTPFDQLILYEGRVHVSYTVFYKPRRDVRYDAGYKGRRIEL